MFIPAVCECGGMLDALTLFQSRDWVDVYSGQVGFDVADGVIR